MVMLAEGTEIIMAMRIDTASVDKIQETNPIRRKAIQLGRHPLYILKEAQKLQPDISDQPTIETIAIKSPAQAKITRPQLPLDREHRPYLPVINNDPDTLKLIAFAVESYFKLEGNYPTTIVLSKLRYLHVCAMEYFYYCPAKIQIRYECKEGALFDVMARGNNYYQH